MPDGKTRQIQNHRDGAKELPKAAFTVRLPETLYKGVGHLAVDCSASVNDVVWLAVADLLASTPDPKKCADRIRKLRET